MRVRTALVMSMLTLLASNFTCIAEQPMDASLPPPNDQSPGAGVMPPTSSSSSGNSTGTPAANYDTSSSHRLARPNNQSDLPGYGEGAFPSNQRAPISLHAARFGTLPGTNLPSGNLPAGYVSPSDYAPPPNIPVTNVPLNGLPYASAPLNNIPMNNVPMSNIPMGNAPMNSVPLNNVPIVDINSPIRVLARYQIELIVDRSMSMRTRDCPGFTSRWDWCGMQALDLSRAISPFVPDGLTITPFANSFEVYPHSSPYMIDGLFQHPKFRLGTRLAEPLRDRMKSYFAQRQPNSKPLLIAIITDGVPVPEPEPEMVISELVQASKAMRDPNEVTVVFFQIGGHDRFGHEYLKFLDQKLVRCGARYHYVHTIPFEQLQAVGLARALVDTVQGYADNRR